MLFSSSLVFPCLSMAFGKRSQRGRSLVELRGNLSVHLYICPPLPHPISFGAHSYPNSAKHPEQEFGTIMIKRLILCQYRANIDIQHTKCLSPVIWSTHEPRLLAIGNEMFWNKNEYKDHCDTVFSNVSQMNWNKAGYTTTLVACGWAGAMMEKVTGAFGQEQWAQNAQKRRKSKMEIDGRTDGRTDMAWCRVA